MSKIKMTFLKKIIRQRYIKIINILIISIILFVSFISNAAYPSRLKDIVTFEGIRNNLLIGYGLVVGLDGSGDNLTSAEHTNQGFIDFLARMGVNVKGTKIKTKNVASVTVTANLPPFARQGSTIDVSVSSIGDAKSLEGGILLATPLIAADGEVYAVAQGSVAISGFKAYAGAGNNNSASSTTVSRGVSTNGFVANGAIIEKEIDFKLSSLKTLNISLINPDISTAVNIANVINDRMNESIAKALDPSTVVLKIPDYYKNNVLGLLANIENIEIRPDTIAKVIIEEASGTIVIGENVRISPVAIAQGNLTVKITEDPLTISQPNPFAPNAADTLITGTEIGIDAPRGSKMQLVEGGPTLRELVNALNALGVTPRDLITILQNIKAAGALQAEIEAR